MFNVSTFCVRVKAEDAMAQVVEQDWRTANILEQS